MPASRAELEALALASQYTFGSRREEFLRLRATTAEMEEVLDAHPTPGVRWGDYTKTRLAQLYAEQTKLNGQVLMTDALVVRLANRFGLYHRDPPPPPPPRPPARRPLLTMQPEVITVPRPKRQRRPKPPKPPDQLGGYDDRSRVIDL